MSDKPVLARGVASDGGGGSRAWGAQRPGERGEAGCLYQEPFRRDRPSAGLGGEPALAGQKREEKWVFEIKYCWQLFLGKE